ncbi:MAG: hypothetical protein U0228_16175 [Myxococcaceae bacterium]
MRTRLEGQVEAIEDGIHLLDSVTAALNREELDADDLQTLREAHLQLPRLKEAVEELERHEASAALARRFRTHLRHVEDALSLTLKQPPPSVHGGLAMVLHRQANEVRAPGPSETVLMTDPDPPVGFRVAAAIFTPIVAYLLSQSLWLTAAVAVAAWIFARRSVPPGWSLQPHRLFLPDPPTQVPLSRITAVSSEKDAVVVHHGGGPTRLRCDDPDRFVALLELLRSRWLDKLEPRPRPHAICPTTDERTQADGTSIVTSEGLLFVPKGQAHLVAPALTPRPGAKAPTGDALYALLTHVPEGGWSTLGPHLAQACDGKWVPRGGTREGLHLRFSTDAAGAELKDKVELLSTPR